MTNHLGQVSNITDCCLYNVRFDIPVFCLTSVTVDHLTALMAIDRALFVRSTVYVVRGPVGLSQRRITPFVRSGSDTVCYGLFFGDVICIHGAM